MRTSEPAPDEIRLLEWANILLRHRWLILVLTIGAGALAYGLCKTVQPQFTAETTLIANREAEALSLDRVLGSGIARSRAEMYDRFSATLVSSYYMEVLRSDALLRSLIDRTWCNGRTLVEMFQLSDRPGVSLERQALETLRLGVIDVFQDKATGMLSLRCTTPEPRVSAEMANALVSGLRSFLVEQHTSGTDELIDTAEARTSETALQLERAEEALRDFRNRNKTIVSPDLKMREAQMEREITMHETLFIKLKTEVALLRISRQHQIEPIIVIQPAEVPLWKSWPPTRASALGAAVFGMLFGITIAFIRHGLERLAVHDPGGFEEFARHLRSLNWMMPGVVFLLPSETRRRGRMKAND